MRNSKHNNYKRIMTTWHNELGTIQDPYVIESEARQDLGYIRPGEHLVVIVDSNQQGQQNADRPLIPAMQSFWQQWWNVFFGT